MTLCVRHLSKSKRRLKETLSFFTFAIFAIGALTYEDFIHVESLHTHLVLVDIYLQAV